MNEKPSYEQSARQIEQHWRDYWKANKTFATEDPDSDRARPTRVVLDFFPYPSGAGLHIGHPRGYVATDVYTRYLRMTGVHVLYAMGFDSFGLPAEQYAIQTGRHPAITTAENVAQMLSQLEHLGLGHDPSRRFCTSDPEYYRWTQWIFSLLFQSYYDPDHHWCDASGREVEGRARPVAELRERLQKGEWLVDEAGRPCPARSGGVRCPVADVAGAVDKARLAFVEDIPVNWCPMLGTVLANEEVTAEGRSERGDHPVYKRSLKQWVLRITEYAERLLTDLKCVDWPNGVVRMQENWIGRSEGAEVIFSVTDNLGQETPCPIYTTRPDTLLGATYMVLSPQHPLVDKITAPEKREAVADYRRRLQQGSTARVGSTEKTGVDIGATASHPITGARLPVWIADYVLMEYGHGAIMAVPAHDQRDFEFAKQFDLPIRVVVRPPASWLAENGPAGCTLEGYARAPQEFTSVYSGQGVTVNSCAADCDFDGLSTEQAKDQITAHLERQGLAKRRVNYRLRDWLFSRQRYWGEPFPIVFDDQGRAYVIAAEQLPVLLPELTDFAPVTGQDPEAPPQPPLGRITDWCQVLGVVLDDDRVQLTSQARLGEMIDIDGGPRRVQSFVRETNTMPNWAGSCWYYLRYLDPRNQERHVDPDIERYWSQDGKKSGLVDLYVGGAEHAVLHLLYARFWHKFLYDLGHASTPEPFERLVNQGMITADAYKDSRGVYVDVHQVDRRDEATAVHRETGEVLSIDPGKMGKRYKNGIAPEEICNEYSTDTFRLYEMYLGPIDTSLPWQPRAIIGLHRFLAGFWHVAFNAPRADELSPDLEQQLHRTIKVVTSDVKALRFNTAIARLIELVNAFKKAKCVTDAAVRTAVLLVAPFAPFFAEEVLHRLFPAEHKERGSAHKFPWPEFDPAVAKEQTASVVVQVNGKKRAVLDVALDIDATALEEAARALEAVQRFTADTTPVRTITVMKPRPKLVNFVVK